MQIQRLPISFISIIVKIMKILLAIIMPFITLGQNTSIGGWKNYKSYNSASYVCEANNKIYCVASGSLFYVEKNDKIITRLSKIDGLSDIEIEHIGFLEETNTLIIIYKNCNIDLIKDGYITNLSDIKRKEIVGKKQINNIIIKNKKVYISSSFGLIILDTERQEIQDTYKIGLNAEFQEITGCTFINDSILVTTSLGVFYADANSNSLFDYNSWDTLTNFLQDDIFENIVSSESVFLIDSTDEINNINYYNNTFLISKDSCVEIYSSDFILQHILKTPEIVNALYSYKDSDNNIWIADGVNGLLKYVNFNYYSSYIPEGPISNNIFSVEYIDNKLYVCHGGHTNFGNWWNKEGGSVMSENMFWENYNYEELGQCRDIVSVTKNGESVYWASYYNGISEFKNGELYERWSPNNTGFALDTIDDWQNDKRISVASLKFDNNGNMWGVTSSVTNPLFVKTPENEWHSFYLPQQIKYLYSDLIIDNNDQKWIIIGRDGGANEIGVLVYSDNGTISNTADDQYKILTTSIGNGKLPSLNVYSITEDLNGEIWIGTDKGICVFYNPSYVFSTYNFDAEQILIQEGDYGQYLLSEEKITTIKIDGANRKWVGTENSGLFLLSNGGLEKIHHFTTENSPILSNNIIDIAINHKIGEIFIATDKGMISYRSDATKGASTQNNTKVFPNPVTESYNGLIAISGLIENANVKITDIDGNLVYEGFANGGQATWDGKNKHGEKASSGVYLVFSCDVNGREKMVSKILLIK